MRAGAPSNWSVWQRFVGDTPQPPVSNRWFPLTAKIKYQRLLVSVNTMDAQPALSFLYFLRDDSNTTSANCVFVAFFRHENET